MNKFYHQLTQFQKEQVSARFMDAYLGLQPKNYTYEIGLDGGVLSRRPYVKPAPHYFSDEEIADMDARTEVWNNIYARDKVWER